MRTVWRWFWLPLVVVLEVTQVMLTAVYDGVLILSGWGSWLRRKRKLVDERYFGKDDNYGN